MRCRHAKGETCLILNNNGRCGIFNQDEEKCSSHRGSIIYYLKHLGTYDKTVKNNPKYLAAPLEIPKYKEFIINRFMKQN